jgi:phosphatidylethanolamine/phosphatidyl-N-methylethanolamine N-methyltransferase
MPHVLTALTRRHARTDKIGFFLMWLRRPQRMGAVVPSSQALARAMVEGIDPDAPGAVVELGGGTGSITRAILRAGNAPQNLIVVEREAELCKVISKRYPGVRVLCADARDLKPLLAHAGLGPVKAVVSGLPLVAMAREDCRRILAGAFAILAPGGQFLQFTYSPVSPVPQKTIAELGLQGVRSQWVFSNLPPAAVWRYRRAEEAERRAA